MNLPEKTIEICKELSEKKSKVIEPKSITQKYLFSKKEKSYYGFKPKKRFQIFNDYPIFKLESKFGNNILTSFSREYDELLKEIANKNNFGYNAEKIPWNTIYL